MSAELSGEPQMSANPIQERWGGEAVEGYLWVPAELFRRQAHLGLSDGELVVLLNLAMHWWRRGDLPYPRASTLADRMGVTQRTVLRHLAGLEDKGLIRRLGRRSARPEERASTRYDLGGLVKRMHELGAIKPFEKLEPHAKKPALRYEDVL